MVSLLPLGEGLGKRGVAVVRVNQALSPTLIPGGEGVRIFALMADLVL